MVFIEPEIFVITMTDIAFWNAKTCQILRFKF